MRQRYRVGTHYGIHVYQGDRPVATFFDSAEAADFVAAMNAAQPDFTEQEKIELRERVNRLKALAAELPMKDRP